MSREYKRDDRSQTTPLRWPPHHAVTVPHEDKRRRQWTNRIQPGDKQRKFRGHGSRVPTPRTRLKHDY